jgi:hypothetical protein
MNDLPVDDGDLQPTNPLTVYQEILRWHMHARDAGGRWTTEIEGADRALHRMICIIDGRGFVLDMDVLTNGKWEPDAGELPLDLAAYWAKRKIRGE